MHTTPSPANVGAAGSTSTGRHTALVAAGGPVLLAIGWVLTEHLPNGPLWIAVSRVLPAGLILLAVRPALPTGAWWHRSAVLGLINFGGFFTLQALAVQHIPAGVAATITATQTLLVPLGAILLTAAPLRGTHLLHATTGILGVALLVLRESHLDPIGITAAAGTAICNALGLLLTRRWGRPAGVHHLAVTGWQMTAGGLLLLPAAVATEGVLPHYTATTLAVTATVSVTTAAAFAVLFGALHAGLPAPTVSRLMLLCPTVVTTAGWLLSHQTLTPRQLLGAVLVVVPVIGACRSHRSGARHRATRPARAPGRHRQPARRRWWRATGRSHHRLRSRVVLVRHEAAHGQPMVTVSQLSTS